jgi:hypothetical protein
MCKEARNHGFSDDGTPADRIGDCQEDAAMPDMDRLRQQVENELYDGESLLWVSKPSPMRIVGKNAATWHIHKRTCVIIKPEDEAAYLNPVTPLEGVIPMLKAYPEDRMEVKKVSPRLTRVTNNSPGFIQRYEGDAEEEKSLQKSAGQLSFFDQ